MQEREKKRPLLGVIGATASGKSALGVELCRVAATRGLSGEVISMDSMLVYRGLDIGTAKPSAAEQRGVQHHLIDVVEPGETFDVSRYVQTAQAAEAEVHQAGGLPIYCGGTAFYLQALLFGLPESPQVDAALRERLLAEYDQRGAEASHAALVAVDPVFAARVHPNDKKRVVRGLEVFEQTGVPLSAKEQSWRAEDQLRPAHLILLESDPETLDERILARTRAMFAAGWPEEAVQVSGSMGRTARGALGYDLALAVAAGELDREEAITKIALATRQFARRQRTWLRRFVALGIVHCIAAPQTQEDLERMAPEVLDELLAIR